MNLYAGASSSAQSTDILEYNNKPKTIKRYILIGKIDWFLRLVGL